MSHSKLPEGVVEIDKDFVLPKGSHKSLALDSFLNRANAKSMIEDPEYWQYHTMMCRKQKLDQNLSWCLLGYRPYNMADVNRSGVPMLFETVPKKERMKAFFLMIKFIILLLWSKDVNPRHLQRTNYKTGL